jgi:hypothetical protein
MKWPAQPHHFFELRPLTFDCYRKGLSIYEKSAGNCHDSKKKWGPFDLKRPLVAVRLLNYE